MGTLIKAIFIGFFGFSLVQVQAQHSEIADTTQVKEMLLQAMELVDRGENDEVKRIIKEGKSLADSLDYGYGKSLADLALIDLLVTMRLADSALVVGEGFVENLVDNRLKVQFLNLRATAYRMKGDYAKSIESYDEALHEASLRENTSNPRLKAGIKMNMGVVYGELGDYNLMLEHYLESLQFAEQANDSAFLAVILNNLGDTFVSFEEPEKAVIYLERALDIARGIDSKVDELRVLTNYANALTDLDELDKALDLYEQAFELHTIIREGVPPFILLHNMGNLNRQRGDYKEAERYFKESLLFSERFGVEEGIYHNSNALGELFIDQQQFSEARTWFEKGLTSAKKLGSSSLISTAYNNLYTTNKELADYKSALEHFENYTQLTDSLFDLEKEKEFADLTSKLELEQQIQVNEALKEQQRAQDQKLRFQVVALIASLIALSLLLLIVYLVLKSRKAIERKNLELRNTTKQLEEILESRDHLMGVIAHDLRSPLATLQGLLDLISSDVLTIEEIRELSKTIEPTLQKNSDTIEGLLAWSQSQSNGLNLEFKSVDLTEIINSVVDRQSYNLNQKNLSLSMELDDLSKVNGDNSAIRMVLRNLLINAIKFTEKGGNIYIRTRNSKDDNKVIVEIEDTGIGIDEELKKDLFRDAVPSRKGTNAEQGNGFGLSMCKAFVSKMNGNLYCDSTVGKGSTFYLELPKA
ncbi:MAG: tetratricopeptide repeat-containing sensor histidine kinase [bacterium]|nr:tetratricopeptide repeat-containing sensor histidine kinase [bacterium]